MGGQGLLGDTALLDYLPRDFAFTGGHFHDPVLMLDPIEDGLFSPSDSISEFRKIFSESFGFVREIADVIP